MRGQYQPRVPPANQITTVIGQLGLKIAKTKNTGTHQRIRIRRT